MLTFRFALILSMANPLSSLSTNEFQPLHSILSLDYPTVSNHTERSFAPADSNLSERTSTGARLINICPMADIIWRYSAFLQSWCGASSSRSYYQQCRDPSNGLVVGARKYCAPDEMCVNIPGGMGVPHTALILSTTEMASISLDEAENWIESRRVIGKLTNVTQSNTDSEIILAKQNDDGVLFQALEMSLAARDVDNNTLASLVSCTNCGRLSLQHSPPNMDNLEINIKLPDPKDVAALYTQTWNVH